MIANAFLTFYRSLSRHRLFASLNVLGLAFGIAVFLVLSLVMRYEYGYDRWLPHADQVYVVDQISTLPGQIPTEYDDLSFVALDLLRADFPQIKAGTREYTTPVPVSVGATIGDERLSYVDPSFFDVLPLPVLEGNAAHALAPGDVVLTAALAEKFFGTTHAIGRTLTVSPDGTAKQTLTVSAVLRDLPPDSTLRFTLITAITSSLKDNVRAFKRWGSSSGSTFLRIATKQDAAAINAGLRDFVARRASGSGSESEGLHAEDLLTLKLIALPDAHFHDIAVRSNVPGVDKRVVISLGAIGVLAIGMAAINYINLATARSDLRAREVALRKVAGATRTMLLLQFLAEATVLVALAALIGLALTELAVPFVNAYGGWAIRIDYAQVLPWLLAIILLLGLGAGAYPALLLSAFNPARVLASAKLPSGGRMGRRLRLALVLMQFTGAIAFAICTMVIDVQADFLRSADRGFQRDGLIIVRSLGADNLRPRQNAILDQFRTVPGVVAVTKSDREPDSSSTSGTSVKIPGHTGPDPSPIYETVGRDYLQTYGAHLLTGRFFEEDRTIDDEGGKDMAGRTVSAVLNASALPVFGFRNAADALGHEFTSSTLHGRATYNIIGVLGDVRFMSPRAPVDPQFYVYDSGEIDGAEAAIRTKGVPAREMIQRLDAVWRVAVPDAPLVAKTADERLEDFYKPDQQRANLFSIGAILAVAIACIGLYGLAAFSTSRRVQEIGIRKTLGASTQDVLLLLVGQFVRPVLIANVIAWPLAYVAMQAWLSGFDQRIALSPWYFVIVGAGALALSTLTVLGQAWRVAHAEPARALRYE